jgi:membrane-bound ClpP family serine protease
MSVAFWPSVFLALGLLLLVLEVFIPSGGMIGLCSIACLALCLWYAFAVSLGLGLTFMIVDLVALPLTAALSLSLWSKTPLGRKIFLKPPTPEEISVSHSDHHLEELVGQVGRSLSTLRPSGHVEIAGRRIDALAEEGFITEGARVLAVRIRSGQLVVRGLLDSTAPSREEYLHGGEPGRAGTGSSAIAEADDAATILEEAP